MNTNPQEWEKEWEQFDYQLRSFGTGGGYLSSLILAFFKKILSTRNAALREKVKELGHQQDDDTIWCTLDEVLTLLKD